MHQTAIAVDGAAGREHRPSVGLRRFERCQGLEAGVSDLVWCLDGIFGTAVRKYKRADRLKDVTADAASGFHAVGGDVSACKTTQATPQNLRDH